MSRRLTLISHAATEATRTAAFPRDEPLEPQGLARAAALAGDIGRVDAAWTSPALRAVQTAEALGLDASVDPALADIDLGHWAGKSLADVEASDPVGLGRWMDDPGSAPHEGESIESLLRRVAGWLDTAAGGGGRIVAVTHAAVIRAAIIHAIHAGPASFWNIDVAPLCRVELRSDGERWVLRSLDNPSPKSRRS